MAKLTMKEREYLRIADEMLAKDKKAQAGGGANSLTPAARTALETHVQVYPQQGSVQARQLAGNSLAYAQQSPKSAQEVALGLAAGNATRPSKGNISALDMNQLRQGTIDNETTMKILRDLGALNTAANARNRETISMVGTDYLKEQATTSKALTAVNSAMDGIYSVGKRLAYPDVAAKKEKAAQWRDFYSLYGYEKEVPLEVMLRAEAIANGTGRTVRDFDLMDDETYDREYAALEEWYKGLDHFALTEDPKEIAYESETGKWAEMADMQSAELSRRETIERLTAMAMGNADYNTLSQYTDTYEELTGAERIFGNDAFVQGYDDQQRFMNLRPTYAQIQLASEYSGVVRGYANAGYDYLTDDELAVYNVLYNTDKDAAAEYLEALSPDLLRRRAQVQYNYNTVIGEDPFAGAAASLATILRSPVASLNTMYGGLTGEDDPNASIYDLQRGNTAIRTAQAQLWGDMASFDVLGQPVGTTIYNTLMSLGDMGMAYLTGGALAGGNAAFAQQAMGFIMSSEAAAGTLHEDLQRGFTAEQALLHGITNGAVEYLSEQIPLGELFSNEGKLAWRILKTGLSEGGEEIFSGTVQIGTDALFSYMSGRESEVEKVYKEYAKTMSHEDAVRATLSHYAEEVALQGVTGFFSGGAMGTAAHTANDMQVRSYGKSIMAEGDVDAMLNIAGGMRSDSQSAEWARRLTEKKNKGKKISTYDVGRLTMAMESDLSAEMAEAPNMVMDKAIEERLVELGEDSANAAKLAPVIRKMYRGQKINPAARMSVRWDNNAEQVVKELSRDVAEEDMGRAGTEWASAAKSNAAMATFEGTTRLFELGKAKGTIRETAPRAAQKADTPETVDAAASAAVEKSAAKVKVNKGTKVPSGKARAVLFDADGSTVEGTSARFTEEGGKLKMTVDTANGTKTIPVEDVQSTADAGLAAVAQYVEDSNNNADGTHQMSAEEANAMMHVYEVEGGDAAKFISNFEKAYLDGYAGVEMAANGMSENAAKLAYDLGKKEAEADEAKRVQRTQEAKAASRGTVAWLGTATSNSMVKGAGDVEALSGAMESMTEAQRTTVEVVKAFADTFKTNVVLFESDEKNISQMQNGSFDQQTNTLYIDVNAGAYTAKDVKEMRAHGTLGYAMMKTLGHEVTHYLEANSAEGYAKYKAAVKQELLNNGQDWAQLVRGKIEAARLDGRKMTYAGAESEVVADASEYMLQSSKFVQQIEKGVRGTVKRIVQNFMRKLQDAFSNLAGGSRESQALRKLYDGVYRYTGNLQELWDAAMEETLEKPEVVAESSEAAEMVKELQPVTQFQGRTSVEKREDGLMAMHNLNSRKLLDTLHLGGFPMPSIAIVKAKQGHTMYGDYSVIFGADTINPQSNADNRVYGNDAWTPIFPPVETELDSDRVIDLRRDTKSLVDDVDGYLGQMVSRFYNNFVGESVTNETEDSTIEKAWRNEGMLAAYLLENGREVQVLQHEVPVDRGYKPEYAEIYDAILDVIGDADTTGMSGGKMLEVYGEQLAAANDVLNRMWQRYNAGERRSGIAIINRIGQAKRYNEAGRDLNPLMKTENDYDATAEAMRNQINQDSFDRWVLSKLNQIFKRKGIYNGKERFTSSGDRKSWKATHYDYTVDNVVQAMLQQEESDIPATNASGLKAAASTMYTNLDEIRADSYRLGKVNEEEFNARMAMADNDFRDFLNAIQAWDYDVQEEAGNLLVRAAKKRYKAQEIVDLFKANGFKRVTLNAAKIAESVIRQVQNIPTGYFEAKPARVVSFDEVRMVVAPDNIPAELVQALEERGIPYTTYDGTDEDRLEKANAVENVQFSSRAQDQLVEDRYYTRAIDKWDGKPTGGRMKVGTIKENSIYTAVGLPAGELYFDYSKAAAALSKHGDHLTKETLKQIPEMLASPVVITEPINQQVKNTINVFGEMMGDNGKPIMVSVMMKPGPNNRFMLNIVRTIEMRSDTDRLITNDSLLYVDTNKKRVRDWFHRLGNSSVPFAVNQYGLIRSISYIGENVNGDVQQSMPAADKTDVRYSTRDQTDTESFKRWFGNSKVVNADGTPKIVYHQTGAKFTVFNTDNPLAGLNDSETPNGMFFKDNDHDIGLGGQYQMAVYLKADNILHFANRHEANDWYQKNVPGYAEIQKKLDRALAEFEPRFKAIEDEQFDPNTSDERVDELFEIEDNLIKELGKVETKYRSQLRELLNNHFLHGGSGYDAIELDYDGHRWVNGVRENVHTYIVFSPTQIKSATDNVGTFAQNNPDIRYSTRDLAGAIDIRDYLGNMKERPSMTETEKILLKRYQRTLGQLAEAEKKVAEQETLLRTATGDEITKTKNRIKIYRGQADRISRELLAMESDTGFARLMATSQEVLNRYLLGSAGNVADAADALDEEVKGLTKQLKAVEADVTRTSQAQRTAFARGLFDQQTLNRAAQKLKDAYGSRMSVKAIADRLALVYGEIYADNGAEGAKRFAEAAKELAYDILQGHKYRYKSETLPMLAEKIGTISLTETDVQEIKNAGMTISEYKKALAPWVKIDEGASDLSSVASNAMYYGEGALAAILGDETEGNLAMNLYNYIQQEKAREQEIGVEGMSEGEMITAVMADIAGSDLPLSTNSKTAEYLRNEVKKFAGESALAAQNIEQMIINAQKATTKASEVWRAAVKEVETAKKAVEYYRALDEHRRVMELREQKQIITEELKSDTAKKLQEKVKAQREEYRAREQKAREYRHAREDVEKLRRKVGRDIKRLNTMRVRETDKKHVPQEFQALADAIMRTFTDSELSRLVFSAEKTASLQRTYRILGEMESDFTYYWDDEVQTDIDNLVSLSEGYSALKKRGPGVPSYLSLEGVELEVEILQGVDNIVSNALNMIDMANRKFLASRQETFEAYANRTGENLVGREDHKVRKGELGKWQTILDETIRTGNMTPVYFFEHLQNPEIKAVFDEIRKGQSEYAKIIAEGKAYVQEMQVKHNYGKWVSDGKLKMKTGQGHTIELTREEAAELYALYKREQANKLYQTEHLLKGGFQYRNIAEKVSEDGKTRVKDNPHQLDAADMAKISEWLTEEQKAYADALVGFLSTTMADYGNAASMSMYGYKKFTESYYIPFRTVAAQRMQKGDEGAKGADAGTGRLRNAGFTNKVQTKANAPLYIGGITETVADHIHKMAAYSAMVQPIEDLKRLLNHKVVEGDGTTNTIRALIGQKYGQAAEDYISQLLKDLNGATQSDNRASAFTDKMISAFKRGAVMASASVVLQQPTAMARAMAYISPKYFAQNPFFRPSKSVWTEMMQYAGDAVIKDMGKFDIGMGLSATQYIMDEKLGVFETYRRLKADSKTKAGKAAFDRLIDRLTAAPGKADQWTWSIIWKAVKAEQAAANPGMDTASEAFLQKCGERFNDVIDHTQVYDSVLTRSNLMRSSNQLHKMATSFMSEPVLSINMLYDAVMGKHGKKKGARIIGSVVASQVLAGAMAALVQAWNDDEDKRNWLEKYADRATGNILSNINIFGMIPYISDLVSLFEGYDVERPDMSAIADLIDYTKTFMKSFENGGPTWKQVENFAGTWANLMGIPAKNISREVRRTRNMIWNTDWSAPNMSNVGYVMMENLPGYSDKNTVYYDRIVAAELRGDEEEAEDLRTYMLTSKMVAEDKLTSGLKTAMKDRYIDGDVDDDTAIAYLQKVGAEETEDDAYWEVDKWKYARETGDSTANYRKYDDFFEAVESGTNLKATVQVYLDNGVSKTTLASQITSKYKPVLVELWKAGKKGEFADLQARILTAYEALGYDRAKKLKDIKAWLK